MTTRTKGQEIEYLTELMLRKTPKEPSHFFRNYCVDTLANISFYFPLGVFNEVFIAGIDPKQSLKIRMAGAMTSLVSARVYGRFRDGVYGFTNTKKNSNPMKKFAVDTFSSMLYGLPIYICTMMINKVDGKHIAYGVAASVTSSLLTARPYGAYLDLLRRMTRK
jgi:hypothetical protein